MSTIEKKTLKGNIIKVIEEKWIFVAFSPEGNPIPFDEKSKNLYHSVPLILFFGEDFQIKNNHNNRLSFLRIKDGKIIIPYEHMHLEGTQHILIDKYINIDMMPVRLTGTPDFGDYITTIVKGQAPDYIIVDNTITKNDITVLTNRCSTAKILKAGDEKNQKDLHDKSFDEMGPFAKKRAADLLSDFNINELSENPAFLARVHLRRFDFSRTKQLLLDFNLSEIDTQYILCFLDTIEKSISEDELLMHQEQLTYLKNSFQFYQHLIQKNDANIRTMIGDTSNPNELTTYRTLLTKVKHSGASNEEQLIFTEYENMILETKGNLPHG